MAGAASFFFVCHIGLSVLPVHYGTSSGGTRAAEVEGFEAAFVVEVTGVVQLQVASFARRSSRAICLYRNGPDDYWRPREFTLSASA